MTTELPYRIFLTVLLLGVLGKCENPTTVLAENPHSDQQQPHNSSSDTSDEDDSPLSRSMPFYNRDYHRDFNYRDSYGGYNSERNSDRNSDRNSERSDSPVSTIPSSIISSTSYSIKPGSGSGTNVYMNTKPIPIIITADRDRDRDRGTQNSENYFSRYKGPTYYDLPRRESSSYYAGTNSRNDCYNSRNCQQTSETSDDHRTYYSVLNGNLKYPERLWSSPTRLEQTGNRRNDEVGAASEPVMYDRIASFPFRVRGAGPEKDKLYPELLDGEDEYKRRVTRTSTSSPGWVKLQPAASHKVYDPFLPKQKESSQGISETEGGDEKGKSDSQFANRLGMEISPESFAARWGWGSSGPSVGSGSRLPSWLEEFNNKYEHRRPHTGPTRDEDTKNWVKLDPIPVAGVSISKWVPKGTSPSELPSTGNLIRDQMHLGNKHQAWWDRPEMTVPVIKKPSSHHQGWGSQSTRIPTFTHKSRPEQTSSWKDVIYPDTPISATASWVESATSLKGASSYQPSFSSSSSSSNGWMKQQDSLRRPSVGSWSAPGSSGSHHRFNVRRPTSGGSSSSNSHYPDPNAGEDDPRWVLVSNSRRVTGQSGHGHYADRHRYRPNVDRWRDDLDLPDRDQELEEQERDFYYGQHSHHNSHRVAKNVRLNSNLEVARKQEEAFQKINATLHTLKPFLNHKENASITSTPSPTPSPKPVTTTTAKSVVKKTPTRGSFFSSLLGDGRKFTETTTAATNVNGTKMAVANRRPNHLKPILAAVGAGMIPATMAAVLPMVMGRRKKREAVERQQILQTMEFIKPVVVHNKLVFVPSGKISRRSNYFPIKSSHFLRQQQGDGRSEFVVTSIAR